MTRPMRFLLVGILVLGGFLLGQLESQVDRLPAPAPDQVAAEAVARQFYAGLNRFLSSGDRAVTEQLAPDFVDHSVATQTDRTEEAMFATLAGAAEVSPAARFVIDAVDARGSMVAITVRLEGVDTPMVGGRLPVLGVPEAMIDFLRLERNLVSERWSNDHALPRIDVFVQTEFAVAASPLVTLRVERWTFDPFSSITMLADLPVAFAVDSGRLRIEANGVDATGAFASAGEALTSGESRIVDPTSKLLLRNLADEPTVVWVAGLYPDQLQLSVPALPGGTIGVTRNIYAFGSQHLTAGQTERLRLSVTRISLPGGSILPTVRTDLIELTAVLAGELHVSVDDGFVSHCSPVRLPELIGDSGLATAGEGFAAVAAADSMAGYQVAGVQPGTLIVATLESIPEGE